MSSDEKKKPDTDKHELHFTVLYAEDARWPGLAKDLRYWDNNAAESFVVVVNQPFYLPTELNYVMEEIHLHRPKPEWMRKDEEDQWEYIQLRTRIFRYDRRPTPSIVPPISPPNPSQPYAEIQWSGGSVSSIEIRGLENLVSRGGGVANEAKRLADAADSILRLSHELLDSWYQAQKAKSANNTEDKHQPVPRSSEEQKWLAQARLAARAMGKSNSKLTNETLAEATELSVGTIKNRRRDYPNAWLAIEAAHVEGVQECNKEQIDKKQISNG